MPQVILKCLCPSYERRRYHMHRLDRDCISQLTQVHERSPKIGNEVMAENETDPSRKAENVLFEENGSTSNRLSHSRFEMAVIKNCPTIKDNEKLFVDAISFYSFLSSANYKNLRTIALVLSVKICIVQLY